MSQFPQSMTDLCEESLAKSASLEWRDNGHPVDPAERRLGVEPGGSGADGAAQFVAEEELPGAKGSFILIEHAPEEAFGEILVGVGLTVHVQPSGGITGLVAALRLAEAGLKVALIEREESFGGLARSFPMGGESVSRYYHFICQGDRDLLDLIIELGLGPRLTWHRTRMSANLGGKTYDFSSPLDLLRFRPLPFADRVRLPPLRSRTARIVSASALWRGVGGGSERPVSLAELAR